MKPPVDENTATTVTFKTFEYSAVFLWLLTVF